MSRIIKITDKTVANSLSRELSTMERLPCGAIVGCSATPPAERFDRGERSCR